MGSKGNWQDGLAGVGVNRVPSGFARPRADVGDPLDDRAATPLRTLLTIRRDEPAGGPRRAARPCSPPAPVLCRPVSGFDLKRRLSGEAAIERPINLPTPERQAVPQAAWSHAQGAGPVADIHSPSRAWRSRPRTTLDRPHPQQHPCYRPSLVARQPRDDALRRGPFFIQRASGRPGRPSEWPSSPPSSKLAGRDMEEWEAEDDPAVLSTSGGPRRRSGNHPSHAP